MQTRLPNMSLYCGLCAPIYNYVDTACICWHNTTIVVEDIIELRALHATVQRGKHYNHTFVASVYGVVCTLGACLYTCLYPLDDQRRV